MTTDASSSGPLAGPLPESTSTSALDRLGVAVESAVTQTLDVTERSLARRVGGRVAHAVRLTLRVLLWAILVFYFVFGTAFLWTRYWVMPRIDTYRPWIEASAAKALQTRVSIGRIDTGWRGFHPHLRLMDVRLYGADGQPALHLPHVEATVSWRSVLVREPRFEALDVLAPEIDVRRHADGAFSVAGFALAHDVAGGDNRWFDWVLQQRRIAIRDARVRFTDEAPAAVDGDPPVATGFEMTDAGFDYRRGVLNHRLALRARPPAELAAPLDIRIEFRTPPLLPAADYARWRGQLFIQTEFADIARLLALARVALAPAELRHVQGAARVWVDFDHLRVERLTADLALREVDLSTASGAPPLQLASVQGRFRHRAGDASGDGGSWVFERLALRGADGFELASTDMHLQLRHAAEAQPAAVTGGEFTATRLDLQAIAQLIVHVPQAAALQAPLARLAPRGELRDLQAQWSGPLEAPTHYAVRAAFSGLSASEVPDVPDTVKTGAAGFENLSGRVEFDERSGKLQLASRAGSVTLPRLLATERIFFDELTAALAWSRQPALDIRVESAALANADFELAGAGTYRKDERGSYVDANGRLGRLALPAVARYVPRQIAPAARTWLQRAFVAGRASDGTFRVRGRLADFPYVRPGSGEFRVTARVSGAQLDYLPAAPPAHAWPPVTRIDGDVLFDGPRLEVTARAAAILGVHFERVRARVADLASNEAHVQIEGNGRGPLADALRFLDVTPLGGELDHALAEARANGDAQLALELDIPLAGAAHTRVKGSIALANNDIHLRRDLPALTQTHGRVDFTERSVRLTGMRAAALGGQLAFEGGTRADGALALTANGTTTPQALRPFADTPVLQRLLDRAHGTTRYHANVVVDRGRTVFTGDSDLTGWSLDLPAPFNKAAAEALPFHLAIEPRGAAATNGVERPTARGGSTSGADRLTARAGPLLALRLERSAADANGERRIERGAVRIGTAPEDGSGDALPETGVRAVIALPRLDVDAWQDLLGGAASASPGPAQAGSGMPTLVALQVGELVIAGKAMANVVVGATRTVQDGNQVWLANVVSDHATGSLSWRMPAGDNPGHLSARFVRLAIPEGSRTEVASVLDASTARIPSFDVIAESFELGPRPLGRLQLVASNVGGGGQATWELERLEITNADARMSATGRWMREGAAQRKMALDFRVTVDDAGALLGRFGIRDALAGGSGQFGGSVSWRGSPLAVDYPTLAGTLQLALEKGQFMKADAGAGRLLGVLSLQSLPRRMTLDFRDVFSEGFAFDRVDATAAIAQGVLATRDFRMRSVNATVLIEGSTDLRTETQQLHVLVLPDVNLGSASLVYALLANPAVGLVTFLAQMALRDPLSKAFSFEYDVTGSWSDPQVNRRARPVAETGEGPER